MTAQQRGFRRDALVGSVFALSAIMAFFSLPIMGLNAAYIQAVEEGSTSQLMFENTTGWNALLVGLLLLVMPFALVMAAIFWGFALEAVARSEKSTLYLLTHWCVVGNFNMGLVLGALYQYTFMRYPTSERLEMIHLILSFHFIYNVVNTSVTVGTLLEGYYARTLPPWICLGLGVMEAGLIGFQVIILNPDIYAAKIIIFYLFGTIRVVLLAGYLGMASLPVGQRPLHNPVL